MNWHGSTVPHTRAGRTLVEDEPSLVTGEHSMLLRVLAIEAESREQGRFDANLDYRRGYEDGVNRMRAEGWIEGKPLPNRLVAAARAAVLAAKSHTPEIAALNAELAEPEPEWVQRHVEHWNKTGQCLRHYSIDDPPAFCEQCGKPWSQVIDGREGRRRRRQILDSAKTDSVR